MIKKWFEQKFEKTIEKKKNFFKFLKWKHEKMKGWIPITRVSRSKLWLAYDSGLQGWSAVGALVAHTPLRENSGCKGGLKRIAAILQYNAPVFPQLDGLQPKLCSPGSLES